MARRSAQGDLLTLEVCRRCYLDGWTHTAVAERYGLSRFQVARMLQRARRLGWVRVAVDAPSRLDVDRGDRVRERLGLRHVVVVRTPPDGAVTRDDVAWAAAELLQSILTADDVLGLAWSRTVASVVEQLGHVPRVPVVQLTGALPRPDENTSVELIRRFAGASGGPAYLYYAPTIFKDEQAADTVRAQPEVDGAMRRVSSVTLAVVAVGGWAAGASTLYDAMTPADLAELDGLDVLGEVCSILVARDGSLPVTTMERRMLRPSPADLRAIPHVVAVVPGEGREDVVRSVVTAGLADSLVISQATADALLTYADEDGPRQVT